MDQTRTTTSSASEGRLKMDVAGKKKAKLKAIVKSKVKGGAKKMWDPNDQKMETASTMKKEGETPSTDPKTKAMDAMKMAKYRFGGKGGKKY